MPKVTTLLANAVLSLPLLAAKGEEPHTIPEAVVELPYLHAHLEARAIDSSGRPFRVYFEGARGTTQRSRSVRAVAGSVGWTSRDWTIAIGDGYLGDGMSPDGLAALVGAASGAGATGVSVWVAKSELDGATVLRALGGIPWRELELSDLVWCPADPELDGVLAAVETLELEELRRLALVGYPDEIVDDPADAEAFLHTLLSRAPHLTELRLAELPALTDEGLRCIARSGCLNVLDLAACWSERVTNAGIAELARLDLLRVLDLGEWSAVTDETVELLCDMPSLRAVGLADTSVSPAGLVRLVEAGHVSHLRIGSDDAALSALAHAELETLTVSCYGATYRGLRAFCKESRVSKLVLVGGDIPSGALTCLAQMPELRYLGFGGVSRFHLPYLQGCRLETLELIGLELTAEALDDLAELGAQGTMREVVFTGCRLDTLLPERDGRPARFAFVPVGGDPERIVSRLPGVAVRFAQRRPWWE